MTPPQVDDVIRGLAAEGRSNFHASYIAKLVGVTPVEAHSQVSALVAKGLVDLNLEAVCPTCGRTVKVLRPGEAGSLEFECTSCDKGKFGLELEHLLITYSPSQKLLLAVARERSKKKERLPREGSPNLAADSAGAATAAYDFREFPEVHIKNSPGASVSFVSGDSVGGDKVGRDKVGRDKVSEGDGE